MKTRRRKKFLNPRHLERVRRHVRLGQTLLQTGTFLLALRAFVKSNF